MHFTVESIFTIVTRYSEPSFVGNGSETEREREREGGRKVMVGPCGSAKDAVVFPFCCLIEER